MSTGTPLSKSPYKLLLAISQHVELFLTQPAENYTDLCLNKTNKKNRLASKQVYEGSFLFNG